MGPLREVLQNAIRFRGPIPVATYMRQSLTHPEHGYYITRDPLGTKGDFVTSPEISQMFGELVGINLVTQWMALGKPSSIRIAELGPGRGTLMADLLRAARSFPQFFKALQDIQLVEASPELRKRQKSSLEPFGLDLKWSGNTSELSKDGIPTFVVAHEFFDALPIHKFELTAKGWEEHVVDVVDGKFVPVLGGLNPALSATIANQIRYSKLPLGSQIEVCPEAWEITKQLSDILRQNTGSALIMDYGPAATIPINTLRAFRHHHQESAFDVEPGDADLTADVDFRALAETASSKGLYVQGPVTQRDWLHRMGIGARTTILHGAQKSDDARQRVVQAYERLVDPQAMGKTYKVMALSTTPQRIEGFYDVNGSDQAMQ